MSYRSHPYVPNTFFAAPRLSSTPPHPPPPAPPRGAPRPRRIRQLRVRPPRAAARELPPREIADREREQIRRHRLRHLEDVDGLVSLRRLAPLRRGGHQGAQPRRHREPRRPDRDADPRGVL